MIEFAGSVQGPAEQAVVTPVTEDAFDERVLPPPVENWVEVIERFQPAVVLPAPLLSTVRSIV